MAVHPSSFWPLLGLHAYPKKGNYRSLWGRAEWALVSMLKYHYPAPCPATEGQL